MRNVCTVTPAVIRDTLVELSGPVDSRASWISAIYPNAELLACSTSLKQAIRTSKPGEEGFFRSNILEIKSRWFPEFFIVGWDLLQRVLQRSKELRRFQAIIKGQSRNVNFKESTRAKGT